MMLKQVSRFTASSVAMLGIWGMSFGCLEDDGPSTGNGGTGGTGTGGSGTGGSGTGGGGTGGAMGGSGGAGMGGGGNTDPTVMLMPNQCNGIGNDDPCFAIGTCADRPCGIADYGTRNCVCGPVGAVNVWDCESCTFDMTNLPAVLVPPGTGSADAGDAGDAGGGAALEACATTVADNIPCTDGDRCKKGTGAAAELCVCLLREDDGTGPLIWDCDDPPSFWPAGSF
jgi:hypothetical protein